MLNGRCRKVTGGAPAAAPNGMFAHGGSGSVVQVCELYYESSRHHRLAERAEMSEEVPCFHYYMFTRLVTSIALEHLYVPVFEPISCTKRKDDDVLSKTLSKTIETRG